MSPSSTLCFLLLIFSFILLLNKEKNKLFVFISGFIGILVSIYGLITYICLKYGFSFSLDNLWLPAFGNFNGIQTGRMAHSSGMLFFILGTSPVAYVISLLRKKDSIYYQNWAIISSLLSVLFSLFFITAYGFNTPLFYDGNTIPIALTSSITFMLIGTAYSIITMLSFEDLNKELSEFKSIKYQSKLKISFATILFGVLFLSAISYFQTDKIHNQLEIMYNHPYTNRKAIGNFKADILAIQKDFKDIFISDSPDEISKDRIKIELSKVNAQEQLAILLSQYLGSSSDIYSLKNAYILWIATIDETFRLYDADKSKIAFERTRSNGINDRCALAVLYQLKTIDIFSLHKADYLFSKANRLELDLNNQLLFIVLVITILLFILYYILYSSIKKPITILNATIKDFKNGDLNARSSYIATSEFGVLSQSFNEMVDKIQTNALLEEKIRTISNLMLSENEPKKFFNKTLTILAEETGSQMAAIYLLQDDKIHYKLNDSIGFDNNARQIFNAANLEGEFGKAIITHRVQHISLMPENNNFVFNTVGGTFIPHDIITIPILSNNEVVAVISLANLTAFTSLSLQLIDKILVTLYARIEGVIAYDKLKLVSKKLEFQNRELESQKKELATQSTELIEHNIELEMQKKQLHEASQLKTNFLSNMSHELRTPLNSVIALSGVLNRRLAKIIPDEEFSYLEIIERNGKHLLELINDVLDISRIEAGREEMEISNFNINVIIKEVVHLIQPQATHKNIEILFNSDIPDNLLVSDADKCKHILQNLIGNAVKFTEKGNVQITVQKELTNICIKIKDTGIGIEENNLEHIFDEFRQADGSTSRRYGGSGLGLAIAKKYTHLLGGTINVISEFHKGSEFIVTLPLHFSAEHIKKEELLITEINKTIQPFIPKFSDNKTSKTILLVEDSEPAIVQIKDFLEDSGFNIIVARNGIEALNIIDYTIPDAMILDLMMPDVDGFSVLETVRNIDASAHIPVLILTAKHITKEDLRNLKRNNIHQLIQKGDVKRDELLNAVNSMVFQLNNEIATIQRKPLNSIDKPIILIVEDNTDNMITVKALLTENFVTYGAVNGLEGIEFAKKYQPHLILMDIALPDMDGIQAFKIIRNNVFLQHIPIIALTASAMTSDRETILAHGFDAYLAKPINEKHFFKIINETLYGK
jgi:signal transduction histidine kinase/DNA-binding response OmpR family regulator/HAMP domain-containing protein